MLIRNLMTLGESIKENAFAITPPTHIVDFTEDTCDVALNSFLKGFESDMPAHIKARIPSNQLNKPAEIRRLLKVFQAAHGTSPVSEKLTLNWTKWNLSETFLDSEQSTFMWLLKPTFLNRGRGIHVFNNLTTLERLISEYAEGFEEKSLKKPKEDE